MSEQQQPKKAQYADSGLSDKAFKNMIVYGVLYAGGFLVFLILAIKLDLFNRFMM